MAVYSVHKIMNEARRLAAEYRKATGQTLPITSEIAVNDVARLMNLETVNDRNCGYDAIGKGEREGLQFIIKGRTIFDESKSGHRLGQFKFDIPWDGMFLVLMDEEYEPFEIFEASREELQEAVNSSQASKKSKRGPISVAKFKIIGHLVWTKEEGLIDNEVWDNQADV
ncbi:MAG: hypothetical protein OEX83_06445 [Gammaproteobacteria bacterium]|nr:hypothetical protein [Gammaproteobacteria bacterium]